MKTQTKVNHIELKDLKQTKIHDSWNTKLCTALVNIQIGCGILITKGLIKTPFTIEKVDEIVDACVAKGALASRDGKNSDNGYVADHEKMLALCGVPGKWKKHYPKLDADGLANMIALLQWGAPVELRDEGKHSLLACGTFIEDGVLYLDVIDPWPDTDDKRFNTVTKMTQRLVNGVWKDSRSIEYYGWFENLETKWL